MLKKTSLFLSKSLRQLLQSDPDLANSERLSVAMSVPTIIIAEACRSDGATRELDEGYQGPPALKEILAFGQARGDWMRSVFARTQRVETALQVGMNKSITFKVSFFESGRSEAPFWVEGSVNQHAEICNVWCKFSGQRQALAEV